MDDEGTPDPVRTRPAPLVLVVGSEDEVEPVLGRLGGDAPVLVAPTLDEARRWLDVLLEARSPAGATRSILRIDELEVDLSSHRASWHGSNLLLTEHELFVLAALVEDPGRAWSYAELADRVWGYPCRGDATAVRSALKRLRRKLRSARVSTTIQSVRGFGVRLGV